MTGFGAATREGTAGAVSCELRSSNHRALKVSLRLPPPLAGWEGDLEARVRDAFPRGAVQGSLRADRAAAPQGPLVDRVLARRYAEALAEMGSELGLPGEPDLRLVASLPGVVVTAVAGEEGAEALRETALQSLDAALAELDRSRSREGAALQRDFTNRIKAVEKALGAVKKRAPKAAAAARERLKSRLRETLSGAADAALRDAAARELSLLADRGDVTEEVTRLGHHIESFRAAAAGKGEVGRRLDFLLQEMLREINTIGSKSQDAAIAAAVVDMKVETDRMKEQAANVE